MNASSFAWVKTKAFSQNVGKVFWSQSWYNIEISSRLS